MRRVRNRGWQRIWGDVNNVEYGVDVSVSSEIEAVMSGGTAAFPEDNATGAKPYQRANCASVWKSSGSPISTWSSIAVRTPIPQTSVRMQPQSLKTAGIWRSGTLMRWVMVVMSVRAASSLSILTRSAVVSVRTTAGPPVIEEARLALAPLRGGRNYW